jgi:hypothetical protein
MQKTETKFRFGFAELVRFVLLHLDKDPKQFKKIKQIWRRNAINHDLETAQALAMLAPEMSRKAVAKANPFIEDYEAELKELENERGPADDFGLSGGQRQQRLDNV